VICERFSLAETPSLPLSTPSSFTKLCKSILLFQSLQLLRRSMGQFALLRFLSPARGSKGKVWAESIGVKCVTEVTVISKQASPRATTAKCLL